MRLKPIVPIATAAVVLISGVAIACQCGYADPFLTVAERTPFIARTLVVTHSENGMDVEILEVYRGEESQSTVRVWGDNGAACRRWASDFPDGSEWVLALHPISDGPLFFANEPSSDFQISRCGEFALVVDGGLAKSAEGSPYDTELSLSELRRSIGTWTE